MSKKILLLGLLLILVSGSAVQAVDLSGREIMLKVDNRDDGETVKSRMKMTLINKVGDKRIRELISYQKDYGKDSKGIMIFESPADVKGTAYLSWEYDDQDKEDNRWLYLPALRKTRRISGSSSNDYFMGTDFTYDDMGDRNVDEDEHSFLKEEELQGFKCWVVQSVPREIEDGDYSKRICWVRQDIKMVVKADYYNEYGLLKTYQAQEIARVDGIWTPRKRVMTNQQDEHQTIIELRDIEYNLDFADNLFKTSTIERGNIRY